MVGDMAPIEPVRLILVAAVGFFASTVGTNLLIRFLTRRQILDQPNERSSHTIPTPRGGGIAVLGAALAAWLMGTGLSAGGGMEDVVVLVASAGLGLVCFIDDWRGLSALPRLFAQCVAIVPGLWLISDQGGLFHSFLPPGLDIAATGLFWLWFINLFNFMDGIDGITGVEITSIGIGLAGLAASGAIAPSLLDPAIALTAAALGFLVWNWSPARIFMGDVGSIPIGYLLGWLLIGASQDVGDHGSGIVACLILPAYYLFDASITLGRRLWNRENVLQAHRQHFYQKAAIRGVRHKVVCGWVILANSGLIVTAWFIADLYPIWALALASLIVLLLLSRMIGAWNTTPSQPEAK
jgi:UDP-N-acetylmuramyl pentapeptide phosphotransferase/UDP-N-acetylglucosamine-1-phosphate transferase